MYPPTEDTDMRSRLIHSLAAALLLATPLAVQAQDAPPEPAAAPAKPFTAEESAHYMELGKQAIGYFFDGQADSLLAMMRPETQERVGGIDGVRQMMDQIGERAGMVLEVVDQKMTRREGRPQFWWEANFSEFDMEPLVFRYIFDEDGLIRGAGVGPKSQSRFDPEG
jgi:hypothetical protein